MDSISAVVARGHIFPRQLGAQDLLFLAGKKTEKILVENGEHQAHPGTAVSRAIHWLQSYINENPYTDAAKEARDIIYGLETVRERPALDELLALIGQIAKSDLGLEEINRAKIRISEPGRTSAKPYVVD